MLTIETPKHYCWAFDHLGFRPFFLLGSLFSVASIAIWFVLYNLAPRLLGNGPLGPMLWHGHEMIYGYAMAVIAGFLLTAVRNWTGVQTLHGPWLLGLAALWLGARIAALLGPRALPLMATCDLLFLGGLTLAILYPIVKVRQWSQLGVWAKVLLLFASNVLFYLGLFGVLNTGIRWGLYSGLYLIVSLVLLMGRRVIPFFIERGVEGETHVINHTWLDVVSLVAILLFWLMVVFFPQPRVVALLAVLLFVLHMWRLVNWHATGLWRKPLLWVLYLGYAWIATGFGLTALAQLGWVNPLLAVHAFTYGGIGMVTLGMMARVSLGHTGRDVFDPPKILGPLFALLFVGSLVRVVAPMIAPSDYRLWIGLSQLLWIIAFGAFCWRYAPMLIMPRIDGRYG